MRRLITWLSPYKLQVAVSIACILLKSGLIISGPYFVSVAVDRFMSPIHSPLSPELAGSFSFHEPLDRRH